MSKQLDLLDGVKARDDAIESVAEKAGDFMTDGVQTIGKLPTGQYTGEDIRFLLTQKGITPHHPNAWGALIMNAVRAGLLIDTGRVQQMTDKTSHARKTSVYLIDRDARSVGRSQDGLPNDSRTKDNRPVDSRSVDSKQ